MVEENNKEEVVESNKETEQKIADEQSVKAGAEEEKSERLHELQTLLNKQKTDYNNGFVDKKVEVLVKGKGKKENQYRGTTKWMQSVIFECDNSLEMNKVNLKIISAEDNCLLGDLI